MAKVKEIELGTEVYIIDDGKIMTGKVTGYQADFHAPWNEFMKNYDKTSWLYGVNNKLLGVWVNIPSVTKIDGSESLCKVDSLFLDRKEAEKEIVNNKKDRNKNIQEQIDKLKALLSE